MQETLSLKIRAAELEKELDLIQETLHQLGEETHKKRDTSSSSAWLLPPPSKSGYLFKWQDRSIGFSGSKWALRFVKADRGRLSYYYSHLETQPRYVLSLRGCAVRDEGWKRNRRAKTKLGKDPPLEEAGAYFFVFSIYYRPDSSSIAKHNHNESFVPLLRFSTTSMAEKTQWIQILSEACAYCETDAFLREEANRNQEEESRRQQQLKMVQDMPQAERGTLAPLYFAVDKRSEERRSNLLRRPSHAKLPKSNLFRTTSKSRDAEKVVDRSYPPSKPMHRASAPSHLSSEAPTQNYRGFLNLAMIILIVSNFRILLNSIRMHGFILTNIFSYVDGFSINTWDQFPFLSGILVLQAFLVSAFCIEWLLATKRLPETVGMILHQLNAHTQFASCTFIVWNFIDQPPLGITLLLNAAITWMKLLSYAHANQDYRLFAGKDKETYYQTNLAIIDNLESSDFNIEYPTNVSLRNIYYYWLAPTLTYQIAFPRASRVRPLRVLGLLIRMAISLSLFTFLGAQVVAPNLSNLVKDLEATEGRITSQILAEYWLKLTISNTYMWLLVFYFYFHLYLNLFAELLRFGDRVFYKDWWNSAEVSAYWRLWNLPVHYWLGKSNQLQSIYLLNH
jgi:diacylglycerol O-acyltransferase-1